ncbi:pyridoxal phosphate-dependent aminotransferase [Lutibacter sp. B2]|nr:pyridoxal phosphate-dependent aminotransferase [Lutibacter sp. B2]
MNFSKRIIAMDQSPIRKLTPYAERAKEHGKKIYHLNIGQPDILTPKSFMNAIKNTNAEILKYTSSQGIPELIDAFINFYKEYNFNFERDEILVTNGASEGLFFSAIAIADDGDEILVPEPFYTNYQGFLSATGIKTVPVPTSASTGFRLPNKETFSSYITSKTKAILLSNPSNPTGIVYTLEEMQLIADIAKENDLFILADEVYRDFVYDNIEFHSFMNMKEIEDKVILIDSLSKRFSACGCRIGAIITKNKELIAHILKLCQLRLCCPMLEQIGAVELLKTPKSYFKEVLCEYEQRRNVLYNELQKIPNIVFHKPEGAFYVIVKLPIENAEDFAIWLLNDFDINSETVMLAPAKGFYSTENSGMDEVRIAYILNEDDLKKSMYILKEGLTKYLSIKNR